MDLESGAVVFIGEGKGGDALDPFWKRLRASHAHVKAVATDLSPAYLVAVSQNLPEAIHVFDHFHVVKLFNDKLANLRRDIQKRAGSDEHKQVIKGTRWLLLKNQGNLDENRDERQRLNKALEINQPLATAYYLKEDLRQLYYNPSTSLTKFMTSRPQKVVMASLGKAHSPLKARTTRTLFGVRHPDQSPQLLLREMVTNRVAATGRGIAVAYSVRFGCAAAATSGKRA